MLRSFTGAGMMSVALVCGATAQTATPMSATTPSAAGPFVAEQGIGEFRASKFVGLSVYGSDNQRVGDINEVMLDGSGAAKSVVIGVGGFLGIGEKSVAVPWSAVTWVNNPPQQGSAPSGMVGTATKAVTDAAQRVGAAAADATGASGAPSRTPAEAAAYNGYPDHGQVNLSRADLQSAPAFKYYAQVNAQGGGPSGASTGTLAPAPKP